MLYLQKNKKNKMKILAYLNSTKSTNKCTPDG